MSDVMDEVVDGCRFALNSGVDELLKSAHRLFLCLIEEESLPHVVDIFHAVEFWNAST